MRRFIYQRMSPRTRRHVSRILGVPTYGTFPVEIDGRDIVLKHPGRARLLRELYLYGFSTSWEMETRTLIRPLLRKADLVFFDIGAHLGTYSYFAKCVNPSATVYLFEPLPENVKYMTDIIRDNGLDGMIVEPMALSDATGEACLFIPEKRVGYIDTASLCNRFEGSDGIFKEQRARRLNVQTVTLDEYVRRERVPRVDLIKLDAEETEWQVLQGAKQVLARWFPDIICEILINTPTRHDTFRWLTALGYSAYLITQGGLMKEEKLLTLPRQNNPNRTQWREHLFTRRPEAEVQALSQQCFSRYLG